MSFRVLMQAHGWRGLTGSGFVDGCPIEWATFGILNVKSALLSWWVIVQLDEVDAFCEVGQ